MNLKKEESYPPVPPPIYVVSGGIGASGEQLVNTVLAQFPDCGIVVTVVGSVRVIEQIEKVVAQAKEAGGMIVHTMVDAELRAALIKLAARECVPAIDLVGELMTWLTGVLGREPLGQGGLYRKLHRDYYDRVTAIEYTLAHDDGKDSSGWKDAEIVLAGVSRAGKTPLSLYLSVLGWKVANIPLIPGVPASPEIFELDRRRVIGLKIEPGQLLIHRQQRQSRLGVPYLSSYVDPAAVYEEVENANRLFKEGGFSVIDMTDKTIEASADDIIKLITRQIR